MIWLIIVAVACVFAPLWGLPPADEIDWAYIQSPPVEGHPLGTDNLGRDLLSRIIYGGRVSLTVGFAAPFIGVGLGLILGMIAGYYRGWADEVIGIMIDAWLAIPGLVILLLFSVVFGGSLFMVCLSLGLLFIPTAARITRAATLNYAGREFVLAAKAMGASDFRILRKEVFPNIIWPLIAFVLIDIPIAIVIEAVGQGTDPVLGWHHCRRPRGPVHQPAYRALSDAGDVPDGAVFQPGGRCNPPPPRGCPRRRDLRRQSWEKSFSTCATSVPPLPLRGAC